MITVKLYSRKDCQLCDQAKTDLDNLQPITPHRLDVIDVDTDPRLKQTYGDRVPVVEVGPYRLQPPFDFKELQITLGAAARGVQQDLAIDKVQADRYRTSGISWTKGDGFAYWLSHHYLALINLLVFIYVGLPFLAPMLMKIGATAPATLLYRAYGLVCHQMAFRSFFLFGEQAAYPREAAHVAGLIPYDKAIGLSDQDVWAARQFIGNPSIGYKVAVCERDVAIYGSIVLFGLVYSLFRRKLPALPWYFWVVIALVPIGLDGVTQLISQPPFSLIPYRESTPFQRVLTGFLFGFATAWFAYPMVEESMADTKRVLAEKLSILRRMKSGELA